MSSVVKNMLLTSLDQSSLVKTIKEFIINKSYPLEDRWEVFCKAIDCGLTESQSYVPRLDNLHDDMVMYDGVVHAERYQTFTMPDIIERYNDNFDKDGNPCEYGNLDKWNKFGFDPVAFKEEVMEKFIGSFMYDW